jgi:hypothetical protein
MSLIHTCELAEANPFDYLTALSRHADVVAATPSAWMPWNYRDARGRGDRLRLAHRMGFPSYAIPAQSDPG